MPTRTKMTPTTPMPAMPRQYMRSVSLKRERFPLANEGLLSLEEGKKALWDGSYPLAKKELRKAVEEINREDQPAAASQARYFLALALLDGNLPRIQGTDAMQSVERLMSEAIN